MERLLLEVERRPRPPDREEVERDDVDLRERLPVERLRLEADFLELPLLLDDAEREPLREDALRRPREEVPLLRRDDALREPRLDPERDDDLRAPLPLRERELDPLLREPEPDSLRDRELDLRVAMLV